MSTDNPVSGPAFQVVQMLLQSATFSHRPDYLHLDPSTPVNGLHLAVDFSLTFGERELMPEESKDAKRHLVSVVLRVRTDDTRGPQLYSFGVEMVGLMADLTGISGRDSLLNIALGSFQMLFPFAREAVANLTMRGRFGPVWLQPVSIASYAEQVNQLVDDVYGRYLAGQNAAPSEATQPTRVRRRNSPKT